MPFYFIVQVELGFLEILKLVTFVLGPHHVLDDIAYAEVFVSRDQDRLNAARVATVVLGVIDRVVCHGL
jgi:hypothetical protein